MVFWNLFCGLWRKRQQRKKPPSSSEPVFFISAPQIWSGHVESYLKERSIPYVKEGQKGTALALELGYVNEIFDYYIPPETLDLALEGVEELREIVGV